ncbi:hypothetical protein [Desulfofustis limnaeus]|nr:hypothetical protein [Desulfofustis limnaeus]MDY0039941.1 hypothetical protein [Desulforhabdus sp.]
MAKGRKQSAKTLYIKEQIGEISESLRDYWPLTLRQLYYQLVAKEIIDNNEVQYQRLSRITTAMRNKGEMSWAVMEDRSRTTTEKYRWADMSDFIREQLDNFLVDYQRCLVQHQENYVELWCEKDALARIFERVGLPYCVKIFLCKGHPSATTLKDYADRAKAALRRRQMPVIVYGGDLDPSGWQIPVSISDRLMRDHGVYVKLDRFALNPEQVYQHRLPHNPDALKWTDPNAAKYVKLFGRLAVELDALHPATLEKEIRAALARHLDVEGMLEEQSIQAREITELAKVRTTVIKAIESAGIAI